MMELQKMRSDEWDKREKRDEMSKGFSPKTEHDHIMDETFSGEARCRFCGKTREQIRKGWT